MNDLRDSGIYEKLVRDSGSRPPLPDPAIAQWSQSERFVIVGRHYRQVNTERVLSLTESPVKQLQNVYSVKKSRKTGLL